MKMPGNRVWLSLKRGQNVYVAEPDQNFYAAEWEGTDAEKEAILAFAEKAKEFDKWCKAAREAKQSQGIDVPAPSFLTEESSPARGRKRNAAKSTVESTGDSPEEGI